jgi:hypothetical protein
VAVFGIRGPGHCNLLQCGSRQREKIISAEAYSAKKLFEKFLSAVGYNVKDFLTLLATTLKKT